MPIIKINHDKTSFEECYGVVDSEMQEVGNQFMRQICTDYKMPTDQYTKELLCIAIAHAIPATAMRYYSEQANVEKFDKVLTTKVVEFLCTDPDKHIEVLRWAFFTKVYYDNRSPVSKLLRTLEQTLEENNND